jgi:hypothetical protein
MDNSQTYIAQRSGVPFVDLGASHAWLRSAILAEIDAFLDSVP